MKKNSQLCFHHNFVKFPPTLIFLRWRWSRQ